jgi:hypothetical protein
VTGIVRAVAKGVADRVHVRFDTARGISARGFIVGISVKAISRST